MTTTTDNLLREAILKWLSVFEPKLKETDVDQALINNVFFQKEQLKKLQPQHHSSAADKARLMRRLSTIASVIGEKGKVPIRLTHQNTGSIGSTNGKVINIIAGDFNDPRYVDFAIGLGWHEAGHVAESDFAIVKRSPNRFFQGVLNIIEDCRQERIIKTRFPGAARPLEQLNVLMLEDGLHGCSESDLEQVSDGSLLHGWLLHYVLATHNNDVCLKDAADIFENKLVSTVGAELVVKAKQLLSKIETNLSAQEAFDLSGEIIELFSNDESSDDDSSDQPEERNLSEGDDSTDENSSSKDDDSTDENSSSKGDDSTDENSSSKGDDSTDENSSSKDDDSTDENSSSKGGDSTDDSNSSDGDDSTDENSSSKGGDSTDDSNSSDGDDSTDENNSSEADDSTEESNSSEGAGSSSQQAGNLQLDVDQEFEDRHDQIKQLIEQIVAENPPKVDSLISGFCTEMKLSEIRAVGLLDEPLARNLANKVKLPLRRALIDQAKTKRKYVRDGSVLSGNRLVDLRLSPSKVKPFIETTRAKATSAAVSIIVDQSGSMSGIESEIANTAAFATSMALSQLPQVKHEVLYMHASRLFTAKKLTDAKPVVTNFRVEAFGGTPTDELVARAMMNLALVNKDKKVIIVVTDGRPNNPTALESVIADCNTLGIQVIGIGIQVSQLYGLTGECINDVTELPNALKSAIDSVLL